MISEKKYQQLLKKLYFYEPPQNLNEKIFLKCGLILNERNNFSYQRIYGLACAITFILIFIINISFGNLNAIQNKVLASNYKALANQLTQDIYMVLTNSK